MEELEDAPFSVHASQYLEEVCLLCDVLRCVHMPAKIWMGMRCVYLCCVCVCVVLCCVCLCVYLFCVCV